MATLTVLGIGNILRRDEGVGVRLMEAVRDVGGWPADVEFIDGGVGGLNLLTIIEQAQQLIVFDAADMDLPAGQWRIIQPEQVLLEDLSDRVSLHRMPFIETLRLCKQYFRSPPTAILAIQPAELEYGLSLSPALQAAMPMLAQAGVAMVAQELAREKGPHE